MIKLYAQLIKWAFARFVCILLIPSIFFDSVKCQSTTSKPRPTLQQLAIEIEALIQNNSLFKDSIQWQDLHEDLHRLLSSKPAQTNVQPLFEFYSEKLRAAGDKHSFFLTTERSKSLAKRERSAARPKAEYLRAGVALVSVPYCFNNVPSKDIDFANRLRQQIEKVDSRYLITAFIIDLRNNVGGNMWPMLAGLNAIIEDGTVGYFIDPIAKTEQPWPSYNGQLVLPRSSVNNYKIKNRPVRIIVLIDSLTASSGEMAAVSLIGLPNVIVAGQPSAGYTTANRTYYLSDGTMFNLATSFIADRRRKPYKDRLIPDIFLKNKGRKGVEEVVQLLQRW